MYINVDKMHEYRYTGNHAVSFCWYTDSILLSEDINVHLEIQLLIEHPNAGQLQSNLYINVHYALLYTLMVSVSVTQCVCFCWRYTDLHT